MSCTEKLHFVMGLRCGWVSLLMALCKITEVCCVDLFSELGVHDLSSWPAIKPEVL